MNRYMVDGMLADMREGKRVLYLGPSRTAARHALAELEPHLLPGETMRRANGAEGVSSPWGGHIRLSSVGSSVRGMSVAVLVIDGHPTERQLSDINVLIRTSELVRV